MMLLHILYFELNHCRLTGVVLTDTHVRKELGVYTCWKSFHFIHGQFWPLKSSCQLEICYFWLSFVIHNSTKGKHAHWRKLSQAGQAAKS